MMTVMNLQLTVRLIPNFTVVVLFERESEREKERQKQSEIEGVKVLLMMILHNNNILVVLEL
jgi:hypothetical protein